MSYDLDQFVNEIAPKEGVYVNLFDENRDYSDEDIIFESIPRQFVREYVRKIWGKVTENNDAFPVIVYESAGKPVAWWDCENVWGYYIKA